MILFYLSCFSSLDLHTTLQEVRRGTNVRRFFSFFSPPPSSLDLYAIRVFYYNPNDTKPGSAFFWILLRHRFVVFTNEFESGSGSLLQIDICSRVTIGRASLDSFLIKYE